MKNHKAQETPEELQIPIMWETKRLGRKHVDPRYIYLHIVYPEKIKEGKQRGKREALRAKKNSNNCRKSMYP